jgi:uncharacterized protein YwbE
MQGRSALFTGVGIGIGLMYFADPDRGRRRRALVGDKFACSVHTAASAFGATTRDVTHRASGVAARVRRVFRRDDPDDDVLLERVRARLGRSASHPHAIEVTVDGGCVTLRGPILHHEVRSLMRAIGHVRGVSGVVNALDQHDEPGHLPRLQGGGTRGSAHAVWQRHWAPATRLIVGTAGTALAGYGATRRDARGAMLAATGIGLVARAAKQTH